MTKQHDQMEQNKKAIRKHSRKITPEEKQRHIILRLAKAQGCEQDVLNIFARYDNLLKSCKSPEEHQHIAIMGITELHKLLNMQGELNVNGMEILPAKGKIIE